MAQNHEKGSAGAKREGASQSRVMLAGILELFTVVATTTGMLSLIDSTGVLHGLSPRIRDYVMIPVVGLVGAVIGWFGARFRRSGKD